LQKYLNLAGFPVLIITGAMREIMWLVRTLTMDNNVAGEDSSHGQKKTGWEVPSLSACFSWQRK